MSTATVQKRGIVERVSKSWLYIGLIGIGLVSFVRIITDTNDLTAAGTIRAAIIATCPILAAALGGLWAERAGVVNIGLEGQMILGTWGAAFFTYHYGPWVGILGAALLGLIGGLLHAIATISFGVDHIVSGVAINLIGAGVATYLAEAIFSDYEGGGPRQLNGLEAPAQITIPGVSDLAKDIADQHWFFVSDVAAFIQAMTTNISTLSLLIFALVVVSAVVLWRTSFGLRLRSCGENPQAAETLGVNVYRYKYIAVLISGALAGIGGGFLALVASSGFSTGQTGGRGYIGLAAMIFGNWRPGGLLAGALTFGYTDSLRLRDTQSVHSLLLVVAIGLLAFAAWRAYRRQVRGAVTVAVVGVAVMAWFLLTDAVPREFTVMTPYVTTLFVLALGAQRLRMPAADGAQYRRGSAG
ncbi:ABC transporter permease [Aeromicrobium wangtongii]|uniref:ABC transporter permease n=1 Tax=Aeromicrobium wangtongii TaxID=2969247 RepID=A0ABY5M5F3_9ACTN|nr:ABC transporter permease [Aeromicrobium wangtongii]MCD9198920.1 ABC transporter permease [Aeromicrobium wangtongii]UUP13042.1 ABC transporter permease [Aeromicrobium wangtongii]